MSFRQPWSCAAIVLCLAASLAGCTVRHEYIYVNAPEGSAPAQQGHSRVTATFNGEDPFSGTWSGEGRWFTAGAADGLWLQVTVQDDATGAEFVKASEVKGFPTEEADSRRGPLSFTIVRSAGEFTFDGERAGRKAVGAVSFVPNDAAMKEMSSLLKADLTPQQMIKMAATDLAPAYVRSMQECGYAESFDGALKLKRGNVRPEYVKSLGDARKGFSASDLVSLARYGVSADLVRALRQPAPPRPAEATTAAAAPPVVEAKPRTYSVEEIIRLHNAGVTAAYIDGLRKAGLSLDAEDIVKLCRSGVSADYIGKIVATGMKCSVDDFIKLTRYGVSAKYVAALRAGGCDYSIDDILTLMRYGVSTDYILKLRAAGYRFAIDDMLKLMRYGVSTNYATALQAPGKADLTADQIIELQRHGVPSDFVQKLRQ